MRLGLGLRVASRVSAQGLILPALYARYRPVDSAFNVNNGTSLVTTDGKNVASWQAPQGHGLAVEQFAAAGGTYHPGPPRVTFNGTTNRCRIAAGQGMTLANNACTIYIVWKPTNVSGTDRCMFDLNNRLSPHIRAGVINVWGNGLYRSTGLLIPNTTLQIWGVASGSNDMRIRLSGTEHFSKSPVTVGAVDGCYIGDHSDIAGSYAAGDLYEICLYSAQHSAAEMAQMERFYADTYGVALNTPTRNIVFKGDSLTLGEQGTDKESMPGIVVRSSSTAPLLIRSANLGISGQGLGIAGGSPAMTTAAATEVDPLYSSTYVKNVCVLWAGTNDLQAFARTDVQLEADIASYVAARKAVGWTVIVATILKRTDLTGTPETYRQNTNTYIMANSFGANAVVDLAARVNLSDPTNLTYFQGDGVHLTDAGYTDAAAGMQSAVDAALL